MADTRTASQEQSFAALSGWAVLLGFVAYWTAFITYGATRPAEPPVWWIVTLAVTAVITIVCLCGFFIVNPNMSRVLVLFGRYRGTVRTAGFFWTNPFTVKRSVSLRAHNIASQTIKVNDLVGNPIEIGAVVVWQVEDTAQASFDVEDYFQYVDVQIESAVRQLAKRHAYDEGIQDDGLDAPTLRGDSDAVTELLQSELQQRLDRAGLQVIEARISHLAYAPEIASAMLQRQQASAIVAARQKIVEGAVSMVEDALLQLGEKQVVELDDERRATLVGNLLVVLCGNSHAQPVMNTGSLYT